MITCDRKVKLKLVLIL